jgi:putative ABC transport system permease protein
MNLFKLILRNLQYYKKEHILLLVGMMLSTSILTSSLIIGDSVKFSLNDIVSKRLGKTQQIISTQERYFPASFSKTLANKLKTPVAPVLLLRGMASSDNSEARIPNIQVCGVESNFWETGNCKMPVLNQDEVIINTKLAEKLKLKTGDELTIRVEKVSFVTENAPFVPTENNSVALRMKVIAIANEQSFGNFNLQTSQITPCTVFFPLQKLSKLNFDGNFANLMLISENNKTVAQVNEAIKKCWTIDVLNLKFRTIEKQHKIELSSERVFMDDTLLSILQNEKLKPEPQFTYLINYIHAKDKYTPYSFVSALSTYPGYTLNKNEIIINSWLADDLNANINDTIRLQYYTLGSFRKLKEQSTNFIVKDIVGLKGFASDSMLMPAFKGLAKVDRCSDWEAGIPIDFSKIRDKDEAWWKNHRGTPKAFISYETAVALWGKEFGNSTAIRFDAKADTTRIKQLLLAGLQPSNVGLNVRDIKKDSGWSATNATDFGQLFLSLGFFLIVAAFLLTGLLFSMMIVQRQKEQGIYSSLGLSRKKIYKIFFSEGLLNALIGSFAGIFAGIVVSKFVLYFLNSIWYDIVRTSSIHLYINPVTLLIGFLSNILIAAIIIRQILKAHFKKQIGELTKNTAINQAGKIAKYRKTSLWIVFSSAALFTCIVVYSVINGVYQNSSLFLMAGFMLLISLTALFAFVLLKSKNSNPVIISNTYLAFRNLSFDFKRNITISAIISIGIFIVISTGANRSDLNRNSEQNSSGTGGYTFFIDANIGVNADLSTAEGKNRTGLNNDYKDLSVVQLLRYESDDASCLNLNRIVRPTILGVNPDKFIARNSFSFVKTIQHPNTNPWEILKEKTTGNCIPAFADQTVITWGLGKSLGDSIKYVDERGETIYLVLSGGLENSVFQGNLIISEANFIKHFPSISGSKIILADVQASQSEELKENLEGALRNYGVEIESASLKLATFNSVTNTYLDIFLALGGIALILGTFGLAIILIRSIGSRKKQYAMMQAYGITISTIRKIIIIEFMIILITGIVIGLLAAVTASFQGLTASNTDVPYLLLLSVISLFTINGFVWIFVSCVSSVKKNFISNLRNE